MVCEVCFHHCNLEEGQVGLCHARRCIGNEVKCISYGKLTAIALDPIEKKPLARFHPGSRILSVGSFGCNLKCPFCQNHEIAQISAEEAEKEYVSPKMLCELALKYRASGNIGVAYTYNEPLTFWEYIRDSGALIHENGMVNVLVTNGTAEPEILENILPYMDAMNIDLKSINPKCYADTLGGSLQQTKDFIRMAAARTHVELTTLIVPGMNDSDEEMEEMVSFIASLPGGEEIPYHISRFFPRYHMTEAPATDINLIYHLAELARNRLKYVYTGNC